MKVTDTFSTIIQSELHRIASTDSLFAQALSKPNKTLDGCVNYIVNEVMKSGKNGFADEEIFNMAIHYYDEDDIKDVPASNSLSKIVTNKSVTEVKKEAVKPKRKMHVVTNQQTLF